MARVVSTDLSYAFLDGVQTVFINALTGTPTIWQEIATQVESDGPSEKYFSIGQVAMPQEFKGERIPRGLIENGFEVTNVPYEDTIEVDARTLRDDRSGMLKVRIQDLAYRNNQFVDKLVMAKLGAGATDLCYDGLAFFSASHVEPKADYITAQSNLPTITAVTDAATAAAGLQTALTAMCLFKDDRGEVMNVRGTHVVCAPALEWWFAQALNATLYPGVVNASNAALQGRVKMLVNAWAPAATWWAVVDASGPLKPMIYQHREGPTLTSYTPQGEQETYESFMRKRLLWGSFLEGAAAYGDWRRAILGHA